MLQPVREGPVQSDVRRPDERNGPDEGTPQPNCEASDDEGHGIGMA